ncbi:MAG: hypothetical protein WAP52_02040, partial [Candidatus Sungiibacteriota bacterium]
QQWGAAEFNRDNRQTIPLGILDIAFHPANNDVIFVGAVGSGLWKSEDSGAVWRKINDANNTLQSRADVYKIAINKIKPEVMYIAVVQDNRGRVLRSEDGGASFREIYAATQDGMAVFDIYTAPSSPDEITIATGDGRLLLSQDAGRQWRIVRTFSSSLAVLAVNTSFPGERYVITALGTIAKTFDAGATWTDLGSPTDNSGTAPPGTITHPYANWQLTFSRTAPDFTFTIDSRNPAILYFARNDALFSSSDGGFNWRRMTTLITGQGNVLGGVAVHPARDGTIFVTAGADFYQSRDGGTSWSVKTISLGSSLQKIFVHPRRPEIIFVTTAR